MSRASKSARASEEQPGKANRVLLKDVAHAVGVSIQSVSLALRGEPGVSDALRKKISKTAAEMGYTPDPVLSSLIAYRKSKQRPRFAGTIAFIHSFETSLVHQVKKRYYVRYYEAALERARELGFHLEEFSLNQPLMSQGRLDSILWARGVRNLILAPQPHPFTRLNLNWDRYSAVTIGFSVQEPRLHVVANNQFLSMLICAQELLALGYRRIGLVITKEQDQRVNYRWTGGFLAAQANFMRPESRIPPALLTEGLDEDFEDWVLRYQPDAVISGLPELLERFETYGYRCPDNIGFAMPYNQNFAHREHIAQIDEKPELVGRTTVDLLSGMYLRNERGIPEKPLNLLVEGVWKPGETVRQQTPEDWGKSRQV